MILLRSLRFFHGLNMFLTDFFHGLIVFLTGFHWFFIAGWCFHTYVLRTVYICLHLFKICAFIPFKGNNHPKVTEDIFLEMRRWAFAKD